MTEVKTALKDAVTYKNIECLVTNAGLVGTLGRKPTEKNLGLVPKGAVVYSRSKGVLWAGATNAIPKTLRTAKVANCKGLVAYPGLVDSHSHPVFDGNRAQEFAMRMEGATYQDIANAGGGILSSVRKTRKALASKLSALTQERFERAHAFGVRLLEAKSGYGLTKHAELRSLSAIATAAKGFRPLAVRATCLAAHAIPEEHRDDRSEWVQTICRDILPAVERRKLAEYVDVFCDEGYFTPAETREIFSAAQKLGFKLRLHGDELANTAAAELAVEFGALSVDHLLKVSEKGIRALASSETVATLLPGTSLFLKESPAPARKLIDSGATVALATDFNPGSCTTQNLPFVATLAALQLGMTCAEIIAAITYNGARAMGMETQFGALVPGFRGEPIFAEGDHPAAIYHQLARGPLTRPKLQA